MSSDRAEIAVENIPTIVVLRLDFPVHRGNVPTEPLSFRAAVARIKGRLPPFAAQVRMTSITGPNRDRSVVGGGPGRCVWPGINPLWPASEIGQGRRVATTVLATTLFRNFVNMPKPGSRGHVPRQGEPSAALSATAAAFPTRNFGRSGTRLGTGRGKGGGVTPTQCSVAGAYSYYVAAGEVSKISTGSGGGNTIWNFG